MGSTATPSGSLWRRWDLHIHAPGTKLNNGFGDPSDEAVWMRFMGALEAAPVAAFGITDYFSCDAYFELQERFPIEYPQSTKVFFPNAEFRLAESISADGGHPNIHVLFDNHPELCSRTKLARFFTNLQTQSVDSENSHRRCPDLVSTSDFESATVTLDNLLDALKETFGEARPYLLGFPANNDGLRSTDTNSPRKVELADRIDSNCDVFFGSQGNTAFFLGTNRYADKSKDCQSKPVVSGSDAHSFGDLERLDGDVAGYPATWIKADTTFTGLRQICHEPESRVFIGSEPAVIVRQREDATRFLTHLEINHGKSYDGKNGRWFKDVSLPLNPELVAIIGNKGSGKSAVVDIVGLLGDSRQESHFSFLTDDPRSKKFRQRGFAENFVACATWLTGAKSSKVLSESVNALAPESVRYLPQNYFEQLTNDIEIEQFRAEIEEVVFSHVDETETLGKTSFSELEDTRTQQSKEEVSRLKRKLREVNLEIVRLEEQSAPRHRQELVARRQAKERERDALDAAKPSDVQKPDTETPDQKALASRVIKLTALLSNLNEKRESITAAISQLKIELQSVSSLRERLAAFEAAAVKSVEDFRAEFLSAGLASVDLINLTVSYGLIDERIGDVKAKIVSLRVGNDLTVSEDTDYSKLSTIPDVLKAAEYVERQLAELKELLTGPQRRYQRYLEKFSDWKTRRLEIVGSEDDPKPGTVCRIIQDIEYIDKTLSGELQDRSRHRRDIVSKVYQAKRKVVDFYSQIKESVEQRLEAVRADGFEIEIEASFVLDSDFKRQFLNHIDQRKRGPYRNRLDADQALTAQIGEAKWDDGVSVLQFCDGLIERMTSYEDGECSVTQQAHDAKDLYDYIYSLEYLSSKYELRLGGKNLNELSPGEKGLLLLIFYLQLDNHNVPLVIDQPEDNLDNDSIYKVLAKCIRQAKRRRQVILVTHNPNLAVGADAEQIVFVKLDKSAGYRFSYELGSIENSRMNSLIVDVLEGSQPAFVKRRLKYGIK